MIIKIFVRLESYNYNNVYKIRRIISTNSELQKYSTAIKTSMIIEFVDKYLARILPKDITIAARAVFVKNGTIMIHCINSMVIQEIMLHKAELLSIIKGNYPNSKISNVRCQIRT